LRKVSEVSDNSSHEPNALEACYPTKIDLWLALVLLSASLFSLYALAIVFSEPVHFLVKVIGTVIFGGMAVLLPWVLFGTCYILTKEHLIIRCLSREYPILLRHIYEVFPTRNPLSAPACSLDRLRIRFKGSRFGALISPKDKGEFLRDLLWRCPQLEQKGERLILRTHT
jgi:hypothetical protein